MFYKLFLITASLFLLTSCATDKKEDSPTSQPQKCNCNDLYFDDLYGHFYLEEKETPFTGVCETFYKSNQQLKLHKEFKKGKVSGIFKTYYEDGTLKEESQFEINFQHGYKKMYNPSGELINHSVYRKGELEEVVFPTDDVQ